MLDILYLTIFEYNKKIIFMKKNILLLLSFIIALLLFYSCNENSQNNIDIHYVSVKSEHVFIRNTDLLMQDESPESQHIDSIISGYVESEIVTTGYLDYDLNNDLIIDLAFEIIDLQEFNNNNLPESFDSLAIRVHPYNIEFLDNSTFQYADALEQDDIINIDGYWTNKHVVLGTFQNAGNFNGHGNKFLAFRFVNENEYKYGWIKLYCSQHNDTLRIIDYAYNRIIGSSILAGQSE